MTSKSLNWSFYVLAALSGVIIAFALLMLTGAEREGDGTGFEMGFTVLTAITFISVLTVAIVLAMKKRITAVTAVVFAPVSFIALILTLWIVIWTPWMRTLNIWLSDNPLRPRREMVTKQVHVFVFDRAFWMNTYDAKRYLVDVYDRREKNARLIKFNDPRSHTEVIGIDEQTVRDAFGMPARVAQRGEYAVWTYYPWRDHPDWTMDVFMNDGRLVAIGDSNLPQ